MPSYCCALNCSNKDNKISRDNGLSFHQFPSNYERRLKWCQNIRRDDGKGGLWMPSTSCRSYLCSNHFENHMFVRFDTIKKLISTAIPTIFDLPKHFLKAEASKRKRKIEVVPVSSNVMINDFSSMNSLVNLITKEHDYTLPESKVLKDRLLLVTSHAENLSSKLHNTQRREKRVRLTLDAVLKDLVRKNLLCEELQSKLDLYSNFPVDVFCKPAKSYSAEQQEFALTLHLYGPKAYEYLRGTEGINLPHKRTLARWLESIDNKPGFNISLLKALEEKLKLDPTTFSKCNLVIDAMALKQQIQYDQKTRSLLGYTDSGGLIDDKETEAKEALVFMLVGLNGHWKMPIGYFFTRTLSAEAQKQLLLHCLDKLAEIGVSITSVTMDGHATNISMCNLLGCNFNVYVGEFKTYFFDDSQNKIYVIFDPCHLIKLQRNMLEAYVNIFTDNRVISWQYFQQLNKIQNESCLTLGNKLSSKHINFHNQKMKVSIAAQTLSNSVADAFLSLKKLGNKAFNDCEATVAFVKIVDALFDVMNSRNCKARGTKSPVYARNLDEILAFFVEAKQFLLSLKKKETDGSYTKIINTKRRLGILGLIINMATLTDLLPQLLKVQKFVLTYKFSQDHLELFFNAVRGAGGWNNNPSCQQFRSIFQKLLRKSGAPVCSNGNVSQLDTTTTIFAAHIESFSNIDSHQVQEDIQKLSPCIKNSVGYIAGWVAKKALLALNCNICKASIISDQMPKKFSEYCILLSVKDRGGLHIPSEGLLRLIILSECFMRRKCSNNIQCKNFEYELQSFLVKQINGRDIFFLGEHIQETQYGIDNHYYALIKLISGLYFKVRIHKIAKIRTADINPLPIRNKLTKTILFRGQ